MNETLRQYGISWDNCGSVAEDNTSVNLGKRTLETKILQKNPAVVAALAIAYTTLLAKLDVHTLEHDTLMLNISVWTSVQQTNKEEGCS